MIHIPMHISIGQIVTRGRHHLYLRLLASRRESTAKTTQLGAQANHPGHADPFVYATMHGSDSRCSLVASDRQLNHFAPASHPIPKPIFRVLARSHTPHHGRSVPIIATEHPRLYLWSKTSTCNGRILAHTRTHSPARPVGRALARTEYAHPSQWNRARQNKKILKSRDSSKMSVVCASGNNILHSFGGKTMELYIRSAMSEPRMRSKLHGVVRPST